MIKAYPDRDCEISANSFETKEKDKTNRVILNGYWVWWCYKHNQPLPWCEKEKEKIKMNEKELAKKESTLR